MRPATSPRPIGTSGVRDTACWGRGISAIRGHQSAGLWSALLFLTGPDVDTSDACGTL
jgi:hypothetical protein